ncbi:MBL fold metallo-hydrolase [Streptomyces alfalfae]|uniref:MBL fold metallo-hydrolase n=1 Tax=Streptomyces alfalfae TaxID=1642299 RepID=A0A7T4PBS6_9ACTN|nr:MBL fold metallo-hydrolase [Streptomyces alfalfae]QQC87294.1 MBL fold metallo-hydrolase [Streptomyces alfalfae]
MSSPAPQRAPFPVRVFGGPTALFEYGGLRFLTDPTFDGPGDHPAPAAVLTKTAAAAGSPADLGRVDVVLLSHDEHADNLDTSGRALLTDVPLTLTTPGGGERLGRPATGLADWQSVELERRDGGPGTVTVTGVPAIHGPGKREDVEPIAGQVVGFVLTGEGLPTVYVSGDNASLDAVRDIAERFGPVGTALLFAGAPRFAEVFDNEVIVLDSAQAAEATKILDAGRVVPLHYDSWAHFTEGRDELVAAFTAAGLIDRVDFGVRG